MGNINDSLLKSLNRLGIARQVEAVGVVEKATEEIAKYIPREDFEVVSFRDGILKIFVASSSAANELSLSKVSILRYLKNKGHDVTGVLIKISHHQEHR